MSWTRGSDKTQEGKFAFECRDYDGNVFRALGGFDTAQLADRAAEKAEREMSWAMQTGEVAENTPCDLSDEELLRELME